MNVIRSSKLNVYGKSSFNTQIRSESLKHIPVMCAEVVSYLQPGKNNFIIDMTFGAGGHSKAILQSARNVKLLCLDRDPQAYELAKSLAKSYPDQIIPCLGKFSDLPTILKKYDVQPESVDRILFDFGCSSMQFDQPERGFSINKDGPLDMRMDGNKSTSSPTVACILQRESIKTLTEIFKVYGEEKKSALIAKAIVETRSLHHPVRTTSELATLVSSFFQRSHKNDEQSDKPSHMATKIFQALRIYVNNELNEINFGLLLSKQFLKIGGRIVALSFHSLEDTLVKGHFNNNPPVNGFFPVLFEHQHCNKLSDDAYKRLESFKWMPINGHVITPSRMEIKRNPRSRSAKLRAAKKVK